MVYIIGFIVSLVLWLFTLKTIIESDSVVIVAFPFVGVLYPVYEFVSQYMRERG